MQIRERGHLIQHGRGLRRIKTEVGRRAALLEGEGDFHAAPRGEAPNHAFQTGLQPPRLKGEAPFEIQMAVVYTPYFPRLRPVRVFHDATAEAGHTPQHRFSFRLSALGMAIRIMLRHKVFRHKSGSGLPGTGFPFDFSISLTRYGDMPRKGSYPPFFGS